MSTPVRTTHKPVAKAPAKRPDDLKARVSPAAKLRRRPLLIVLSTFLVAVGALVGAWAWISTTASSEVVVVRFDVARGQLIEAADLATVRVTVDPSVATVPAARMSELVGLRATSDLTAGSLVNPGQTGPDVIPPVGMTIVGVPVEFGMLPAEPLRSGDRVRFVQTPGLQGDVEADMAPVSVEATVVGVQVGEGKSVVDLMVPSDRAVELAARANTGRVALTLETRER